MRIWLKIILFCLIPIVIFTLVVLFITNKQLKKAAMIVADHVLEQKLSSEIKAFRDQVEREYGILRLKDGMLVDQIGTSIVNRYEVVDKISEQFSSTATIFVRSDNDFKRVVTTVKKADGSRADGTSLGTDSKAYQSCINGRTYIGEANILNKPYLTIYEPLRNTEGDIIGILYAGIPKDQIVGMIDSLSQRSVLLVTVAMVALIFCIMGTIFLIVSWVMRPLKKIVQRVQEMGRGRVSSRLDIKSRDEIGEVAGTIDKFADYLQQNIVSNIQKIADGDININTTVIDDKDEIGPSFNRMIEHMNVLGNEMTMLTKSAMEGKLNVRGNKQNLKGVFRYLVDAVNKTLDAVLDPINEAADALEKIADKDMTARVRGNYSGDHAKIKEFLNIAVENLDKALQQVAIGADQVASASVQVSNGGQALSHGASDQASSLEEISSSLQEMSSMTKQNALNAREANGVAEEARNSADRGVESMNRMSSAINRIKSSSDATAKIVKTIDEIAFQTNLLALNAAVEAARAGDAGKGFAVVAEEVRNLARRSAEAAKNTANLIEQAVRNSDDGVNINAEVLKNFQEITDKINKVSQVVAEIAMASDQQDEGISEVNKAVERMNTMTQQNAANAEESASAAEEMSSQSEEMRSMVAGFKLTGTFEFNQDLPAGRQSGHKLSGSSTEKKGGKAISGLYPDPRKVIPLDEKDHDGLRNF
ncbi:MAG: Cache 3/Cache 2 fusion domain-containing protein [Syntrophaceae bacterium]|nr:Cache 3/Cache 2 fusion domain-containing protein [Syntrophaceae bacterium]